MILSRLGVHVLICYHLLCFVRCTPEGQAVKSSGVIAKTGAASQIR